MSDTDQPIALKDVVERFDSSRHVLDQLGDRLRQLATIEEAQRDDHDALREAAGAVGRAAEELREVVEATRDAVKASEGVVAAAAEVLAASDAKTLHDQLARIASEITSAVDEKIDQVKDEVEAGRSEIGEVADRTRAFESTLEAKLDALVARLDDSEATRARERELQAQLDKVRSGLRAGKLRKLGLDD